MEKKKAIKIVTATAIAASAFTAVAPAQSEAAVSVKSQVSASQKAMKKPYDTYTKAGKLVSASDVKKQIASAKSAQAKANTAIKNSKNSAKAKNAYYAQVKAYNVYITRAQGYVDAITLNTRAEEKALVAALEGGKLEEVTAARAALNSKLYKFNKAVAKVYSTPVRDLLNKTYAVSAKEVNAEAVKFIASQDDAAKYAETLKAVTAKVDAYVAATAELKTQAQVDAAKAAKAAIDLKDIKEADKAALQTKIDAADKLVAAAEAALAVPAVESVSAINGKQIKVTFNKEVDKVSAEYVSNYSVLRNGDTQAVQLTGAEVDTIVLSDDKKSAVITFDTDILSELGVNKDTLFKFIVKDVKDTAGQKITDSTTTLSVNDTDGPTLVSASANAKSTTNKVTLTFDEPVDATGVLVTVDGKSATVQAGAKYNELIVTTSATLEAGKTYNVTVLNVKDAVGNFLKSNPTNTTVAVSSDVVAPVITEVKTVRDNLIAVTFDKAVKSSTFAGQVTLVDASGVAKGGAITFDSQSSDLKTVYLAVGTENFFGNGTSFTGTLYFSNKIEDTAGNTLAATNKSITFTKDTTKPVAQSVKHLEAGTLYTNGTSYASGALVIAYDEAVANQVAAGAGTIKILNASGEDVTSTYVAAGPATPVASNGNDAKEVIVTLKAALPTGQYRVVLAGGEAKDKSFQANANAAQTLTVNATLNSKDTTKPVLVGGTITPAAAASLTSGSTLTLNLTDNANLDLASVQNVNNYLVNGAALPTGSYVTLAHQNGSTNDVATDVVVTINIPAGSIAKQGSHVINVVNVKDKAGNLIAPATANVTLNDDIAPVLSGASVASNGSLVLGFSEDVSFLAAPADEFSFKINGTTVAGSNAVVSANSGVGNDAGKLVVTFAGVVDAGADLDPATTADNRVYIDVDGTPGYLAGTDILVKTGTTTAVGATTVTITDLTSLEVSVVGTPSALNIEDGSALNNALKANTKIVVK